MLPHPARLFFLFSLKKVLLLILWRIVRVGILDLSIHVLNQTDAVEEEKKSCNEKRRGSRWKLEKNKNLNVCCWRCKDLSGGNKVSVEIGDSCFTAFPARCYLCCKTRGQPILIPKDKRNISNENGLINNVKKLLRHNVLYKMLLFK